MRILAIESSCDETAAAVVEDGRKVLSSYVYTQIEIHKKYGGVVPEVASRNHLEKISFVVEEALLDAKCKLSDIDAIAVTYGPGLVGALFVGLNYAKGLAYANGIPLIPVNHMQGHIAASYLSYPDLEPPFLCLVVSGGHTYIANVKTYKDIEMIGTTRDDAVGEAYDKVARILGLEYPGGKKIDDLAKKGDKNFILFKRTYLDEKEENFDFSFSGIKSGVHNYIKKLEKNNENYKIEDIAASFQESVIDVLVYKTLKAMRKYKYDKLVLAGGVAANSRLREVISNYKDIIINKEKFSDLNFNVYYPEIRYCTDNAAMIGAQAFYRQDMMTKNFLDLDANCNLELE